MISASAKLISTCGSFSACSWWIDVGQDCCWWMIMIWSSGPDDDWWIYFVFYILANFEWISWVLLNSFAFFGSSTSTDHQKKSEGEHWYMAGLVIGNHVLQPGSNGWKPFNFTIIHILFQVQNLMSFDSFMHLYLCFLSMTNQNSHCSKIQQPRPEEQQSETNEELGNCYFLEEQGHATWASPKTLRTWSLENIDTERERESSTEIKIMTCLI